MDRRWKVGAAAVGATVTVVAAPVVVWGLGFTAGGVAAGSVGAGMMSAAGNVAAGSAVAGLQSVGAAGFGLTGNALLAVTGAAIGRYSVKVLGARWYPMGQNKNQRKTAEPKTNTTPKTSK